MRNKSSSTVSNVLWTGGSNLQQSAKVLTHVVTRPSNQSVEAQGEAASRYRYGPLPGEVYADEAKYGCFS